MSRIHQALRKVARQTHQVNPEPPEARRNLLKDLQTSLSLPAEDPSTDQAVSQSANARLQTIHVHSEIPQLPSSSDPKLVSVRAPRSILSEQYRALKTKLFLLRNGNRIKTILITSAVQSEGKTLTAVNLALTIAQEIDQKVLLVDSDLRNPSVHKVLGLSRDKGLADLLEGNLQRDDMILATLIPNFYVALAGTIPEKPAELLNTQTMRDFLASAAEQFDWVILDSPPIVALTDAELMSTLVDGILLVVRAHHAPANLISKSVQALKGKNVLGVVFNGIRKPKRSKYHYYYGSYGSEKR
jgi:protein-tyrosine kinase